MKTIVLGINYSSQSPQLLDFAFKLAQRFESSLIISHFLGKEKEALRHIEFNDELWEMAYEDFRLEKENELKSFVAQYIPQPPKNVWVHISVRFGEAHEELRKEAVIHKADLILIGKFNRTPYWLFPDTSDFLIDWTPSPVLIVPEEYTYKSFQETIFFTNFEAEDSILLLFLEKWAEKLSLTISCLHVTPRIKDFKQVKKKMEILKEKYSNPHISFDVKLGCFKQKLNQITTSNDAIILSTFHQNKVHFGSLFKTSKSKLISRNGRVPVLIFRQ